MVPPTCLTGTDTASVRFLWKRAIIVTCPFFKGVSLNKVGNMTHPLFLHKKTRAAAPWPQHWSFWTRMS